jgi:hypothetical protein
VRPFRSVCTPHIRHFTSATELIKMFFRFEASEAAKMHLDEDFALHWGAMEEAGASAALASDAPKPGYRLVIR